MFPRVALVALHLSVLKTIFMRSLLLACFALILMSSAAQETAYYNDAYPDFRRAMDLYGKEKYGGAQKLFRSVAAQIADQRDEYRIHCEYYSAMCAYYLFHEDAQSRLEHFLSVYPDSKWNERIYFQLANLNYRKKRYRTALAYFEQVGLSELSQTEQYEYHFKMAYANLQEGNKDDALRGFYRIKDEKSDYYAPTNYYYGHLNYEKGNYQSALESFMRVEEEKSFRDVVPYYVVQIYHYQERSDELLAYAVPLLERAKPEKTGEISRLIGEAYYNKKDYAGALPYLEKFVEEDSRRSDEDNFQLGYCYYQIGDYKKALRYLNYATNNQDRMAQVAQYLMGDAYMKTGSKEYAQNAFKQAANLDFDRTIREDALFNYAKITYELSYNPYHEAIEAFHRYLEEFPNSPRVEEVNEFLIYVYLTTRNYEAALRSLEQVKKMDFKLQSAYQYIAYNRGVELMLANKDMEALASFRKVSTYPIDQKLLALSLFWQGELLYQYGRYPNAIRAYSDFMRGPGAYGSGKYNLAQFGLGYAHYKSEHMADAIAAFRKFVQSEGEQPALYGDALNRIGDCYYVTKEYNRAAQFYAQALERENPEPDYSLYQKAICEGFENRLEDKVASLNRFKTTYSNSDLMEDALFELGDAYFKLGKSDEAMASFDLLAENFPNSRFARKAMLQTGLILYRNQQFEKALETFKEVAMRFPTYEDSKEAIARVEDIYVELGRIEEYNTWVQSLTYIDISKTALDSVNYRAAENAYTKEDCERAIRLFQDYLSRFEQPIFYVNAHFYMAECHFKADSLDRALVHYQKVADAPNNKFSESALVTAAYLNYQNGAFEQSLRYYQALEEVASFKLNKLEAQIGQMRCYRETEQAGEAYRNANRVIANPITPADVLVEAKKTKALMLESSGRSAEAFAAYKDLADNHTTEEAAAARYRLAEILYEQEDYAGAEQQVFEMVNAKPIYDYWLAKSFILLGDIYVAMGDLFQAKATLQSVMENHDGEALRSVAEQKYEAILEQEAKENEGEEKPMEIEMEGYKESYESLFEPDSAVSVTPKPEPEPVLPDSLGQSTNEAPEDIPVTESPSDSTATETTNPEKP